MKSTILVKAYFIIVVSLLYNCSTAFSQSKISDNLDLLKLKKDICMADSIMFNAFNNCDSNTYKKFIASDLEFYHDLGGLSIGIDIEMQSFHEMCMRNSHIRRVLIKSSLEIYPIKNYGAVEIGVHQFYHTNPGQQENESGTYKFIHLWHKTELGWKLSRVISYAHDKINNN